MEIIIASNVNIFFLAYLGRERLSRFLVMERNEFWGCVRGLVAVLYLKEQDSGKQDMLSVYMHIYGTEHGSADLISSTFHLMDTEVAGHLVRH